MAALVRFILAIIVALTLVPAAAVWLAATAQRLLTIMPPAPGWLLAGLLVGVALIFIRTPDRFLHTLVHETCHAVACVLLGVRIRDFRASAHAGGVVTHQKTGPIRTVLILLAPYVLPLLLGPVLLARWWWQNDPDLMPWLQVAAPLMLCNHLQGLYHNLRHNTLPRQSDLGKTGRLFGLGLIASALMATLTIALKVMWS